MTPSRNSEKLLDAGNAVRPLSSCFAAGLVASVLTFSALGIYATDTDYGIVVHWSNVTIPLDGNTWLTIRSPSSIQVFGAVQGLPVRLSLTVEASQENAVAFVIDQISVKGVTPEDGAVDLLDDGIAAEGLEVVPGGYVAPKCLLVPTFSEKPPLQAGLSIDCHAEGVEFSLGTMILFRFPGPATAVPLQLLHVLSDSHTPWLADESWGGVEYFYSIEASYPVGAGVSSYRADLVMSFSAEYAIEPGWLAVRSADCLNSEIPLDLFGCIATGRIPMGGGELIDPGYIEMFHFGIEFSTEMPEQSIQFEFYAESM